jgi:hypothetical protein
MLVTRPRLYFPESVIGVGAERLQIGHIVPLV